MVLQSIMDGDAPSPRLSSFNRFHRSGKLVFSSKFKGTAGVVRHMRLICHEDQGAAILDGDGGAD